MGLDGRDVADLGLLMLGLGVLGARLLSVLTDGHFMDFVHLCTEPTLVPALDSRVPYCSAEIACDYQYVCDLGSNTCHPPQDCLAALKFWQGGLTYYGGVILALPGGLWFAHRKGLGALRAADIVAPVLMLGLFFGRLGCFFNGCCYGSPTSAWVGVAFPKHAMPVHPTQLYEAALALALFFVLHFVIARRKRGHGEVFGWMLALYGVIRILLEILRADERGSLGPFSTSQLLSIPLIAIGIWLVVKGRRAKGPDVSSTRGGQAAVNGPV